MTRTNDMTQPATAAGRWMLHERRYFAEQNEDEWRRAILAIEAEAAAQPAEAVALREALNLIRDVLTMTDENDDSVPLTDWMPEEWVAKADALLSQDAALANQPAPEAGEAVRGHIPSRTCWCVPIETEGRLQHLAPADPVAKQPEGHPYTWAEEARRLRKFLAPTAPGMEPGHGPSLSAVKRSRCT